MQPGTYRQTVTCPYCAAPIHRETRIGSWHGTPVVQVQVLHDEPHCYEWKSGNFDAQLVAEKLAETPLETVGQPKMFNPLVGWVRVRGRVKVKALQYDAALGLPEHWGEDELPDSQDLFGMTINERWPLGNWPLLWFRLDTPLGRPLTPERLAELA